VLSLSFDATSWVEVRSASDRVALQGIFHAGDERTVSVQLPARVVLGNAPAVRLVRDGAAVDLTPHSRTDRTARFSLGAD
jgi:cytoskeleton protein RodZ